MCQQALAVYQYPDSIVKGTSLFSTFSLCVCQAPHRQTHRHPKNEGPSTSNSLGALLATRRSDGLLANILTACSEVFIFSEGQQLEQDFGLGIITLTVFYMYYTEYKQGLN